MSNRFYKKELVNNPIRFNGELIRFETVGENNGVKELQEGVDDAVIAELDRLADKRKMGVVRISAEIAEALRQKKIQSQPLKSQSSVLSSQIRANDPNPSPFSRKLDAEVAVTKPDNLPDKVPDSVPSAFFTPRRARLSEVKPIEAV